MSGISKKAGRVWCETGLADEWCHHKDEARSYVRKLYTNEANLYPDPANGILNVEIHSLATPKENRILRELCEELNETQTCHLGTNLRPVYKTVSA